MRARSGRKKRATVRFEANPGERGTTFLCKVDQRPARPCKSPLKVKNLKRGKHRIRVRAVGPDGQVDRTAAVDTWRVKSGKKKGRRR